MMLAESQPSALFTSQLSVTVNAPGPLNSDEVYSVIAWLLFQNQIIAEDAVIDGQTLPQIQLPNRGGFVPDPRPDLR